jgi:hypothetical protein
MSRLLWVIIYPPPHGGGLSLAVVSRYNYGKEGGFMGYAADVIEILICSPSDVGRERTIVRNTLHEWNDLNSSTWGKVLLPLAWETHTYPEMGKAPQEAVNEQIVKRGDMLIGIFWTRIGTPTDEYASGSVEEIEECIKAEKPVMLFFSSAPVVPDSVDQEQYKILQEFKQDWMKRGLVESYIDLDEFTKQLRTKLQLMANDHELFKVATTEDRPNPPEYAERHFPTLSDEALTLLEQAASDRNGVILQREGFAGTQVSTNGQDFADATDARSRATWLGAIDELITHDLVERTSNSISRITRAGYELADSLKT